MNMMGRTSGAVALVVLGAVGGVSARPLASAEVDAFWGSGAVASPPSEGMARGWNWLKAQSGNTHPGAVMPFGWVSACAYSGNYSSGYGRIGVSGRGPAPIIDARRMAKGFTHFHHSGTGYIHIFYNYFLFTPSAPNAETSVLSRLDDERAEPGYYAGTLTDYGCSFELAARPFAACHRYAFPAGRGRIRIDAKQCGLMRRCRMSTNYVEKVESCAVRETAPGRWDGVSRIYGLDFRFSVRAKAKIVSASCADGVIELTTEGERAETAIGFSLVSSAEAASRADEAIADGFDASRRTAAAAWEKALSRIRATFADARDRRLFYTTLYHSLVKPVDTGAGVMDFSTLWDVYRTQMPLVLSTQPDFARRMLMGILDETERRGYFPIERLMRANEPLDNGQAAALSTYVLADGFFRGVLTAADYPRLSCAFAAQFAATDLARGRSPTYALDFSGALRAAAFVAEACGDAASAADWRARAKVWRTVYDPATGYLVNNDKVFYYEGNFRNYSFRAHPGMAERVALAGGQKSFASMLDDFFRVGYEATDWNPARDRETREGYFEGLNNESDMDTPYTYLWCGRPDRTAEIVDLIRRCRFAEGEGGCPGNNDSGGTSAWYVWASLGVYPFTGAPYYLLGSPSVESAEVDFAKGTLRIDVERESARSIYPAGYVFNGREFREPWLSVSALERGGRLVFRLRDRPSPPTPVPTWLD